MIAIIDYGAGNVRSVAKALRHVGCAAELTADPQTITRADAVVLPGVGSFGDSMYALNARGLAAPIRETIASGRPFLGICLGMQVLFDTSEESIGVGGLGVFGGSIVRLPSDVGLKVPHIGWNSLTLDRSCPLFSALPGEPYVYFVHSYYLKADDESIVAATAEYGAHIHAAIHRGSCFAVQFHPEKSGDVGLAMLDNFRRFVKGEI